MKFRARIVTIIVVALAVIPTAYGETETPASDTTEISVENAWIDRSHQYVSIKLNTSAAWFDQFFSNKQGKEEERASVVARWRNGFRTSEDNTLKFSSRIYASASLPSISNRLRLIVEREGDRREETLPRDGIEPGADETTVGFRYDLSSTKRSRFSLGASFSPGVKARYRYALPLNHSYLVRLVETGFWKMDEGWGQKTRVDLEYWLTKESYLRWSNAGTYSESSDGVEWGSELSWLNRLSTRTAIRFDIGASGFTDPDFEPEIYLVRFRFRRNFLRPWLFYELEPEIKWRREDNGNRHGIPAFTLRLEILFRQL